MRKLAPALIMTTAIALASGSAMALGDRNKDKKPADGATSSTQAVKPSTNGSTSGSLSSNGATAGTKDKKSQVAQNDSRCDESKYASRSAMPKECLDKQGTGAAAVGDTQGQSGGGNSAGGTAASGAAGSSSSSSSSSK